MLPRPLHDGPATLGVATVAALVASVTSTGERLVGAVACLINNGVTAASRDACRRTGRGLPSSARSPEALDAGAGAALQSRGSRLRPRASLRPARAFDSGHRRPDEVRPVDLTAPQGANRPRRRFAPARPCCWQLQTNRTIESIKQLRRRQRQEPVPTGRKGLSAPPPTHENTMRVPSQAQTSIMAKQVSSRGTPGTMQPLGGLSQPGSFQRSSPFGPQ